MATRLIRDDKSRSHDRRVQHGVRTRREILAAARVLATKEGLEALTIGRLAAEVGMSKAGLFAHFGSKEALQLATMESAYETFLAEVVEPAEKKPAGIPRLRSFMQHYFGYVIRHAGEGGCFFTAASLEFDDRTGRVHDRLCDLIADRDERIEEALREAIARGQLPRSTDVAQRTFEMIAIATGANAMFQLSKDPAVFARAERALTALARADAIPAPSRRSRGTR